jgi:hypothetical protein
MRTKVYSSCSTTINSELRGYVRSGHDFSRYHYEKFMGLGSLYIHGVVAIVASP